MRRLSVLLLVPLLFVGFACGDDDDSSASSAGSSTTVKSSSGSSKGFCRKAAAFDKEMSDLDKTFTGGTVPTSDVFKQTADSINKLASDAPKEIKADLETIADGVDKIADVLSGIDLSDAAALRDPANAEKLQKVSQDMESIGKDVQGASERVGAYLSKECGLDVGGSTTTAG